MRKFILKPGFEFVFSLSLIVILGLPPMLLAQTHKDMEIKIVNGDTTVNGTNIKNLPAKDRQEALMDINHLDNQMSAISGDNKGDSAHHMYLFKRSDSAGHGYNHIEFRKRIEENNDMANRPGLRGGGFDDRFRGPMSRFDSRNTQNFDYVNTDNEGISTHIRFHVSETSNEDLKKMPHVEGGKFDVTDLNLVPEFSTGKTLLMFDLPAKTVAEVKLVDSEGKIVWNDKATGGSFSKNFVMGLNGVYYLQVKQGRNISIKKIMKQE